MARILDAAFLIALATIAAGQDAPKTVSVEGLVVNAITGQPVAHARVTMTTGESEAKGVPESYGAISRNDGTFAWPAIHPGSYDMDVALRGFLEPNGESQHVEVKLGDPVHYLRLKVIPAGALTGRVLDGRGHPVPGASVRALGPDTVFRSTTADDRGLFRFPYLAPGKYRLRAAPRRQSGPPEIRTDGTSEEWYGPSWFPGTLSKEQAAAVEVAAGAETGGVEIPLVRIPIVRVSGLLKGIPPGSQKLSVWADSKNETEPSWSSIENGKFLFWRLVPGPVTLTAEATAPDGRSLVSYPLTVDLGASNLDAIALDLVPEFALTGQVEWDGTPPPADQLENAGIAGTFASGSFHVPIGHDGGFRVPLVAVGKFRLSPYHLPDNVYVESVRVGNEIAMGRKMDLRGDPTGTPVVVVLSTAGAQISGVARTNAGPLADVNICAMLEGETVPESLSRSGKDGAFLVNGLAPGRYRLFVAAPDNGQPGANPIEVVEVQQGDKVTRNLTVEAQAAGGH